jgi:hypothetical protein
LIASADDGIVVIMSVEDFDWDRFEAEGEEIARRMREISRQSSERIAALQAERARYAERTASREATARDTPPAGPTGGIEARLERLEIAVGAIVRDLSDVRRDVSDIRERMATKVEVEAVHDSVKVLADGYAQTQSRLADVSGLLKRYLTTE